ncbi:MAG: alanine/glycine:cation symporter family protein [Cyanobacteriota bacterium]|nr:alanine/glycine:cation symporter family protein [Cyanobacteriota bacterium]
MTAELNTSPKILEQLLGTLDTAFAQLVATMERLVLVEIAGIPLAVLWILLGGIFLTIRLGFINIWGFKHALQLLMGRGETVRGEGEVSRIQAMATALSATVGLGNIAGVAIAIELGGPGAVFWMTCAGFLGMSVKLVECTLGQMYRVVKADGTIAGGPPYYLSRGLATLGKPRLGKGLGAMFALCCLGSTLGAGNMFQANQSFAAVATIAPALQNWGWLYGLILAGITGVVIIGGLQRIGAVVGHLVPAMLALYAGACLWIAIAHLHALPDAIATIVREAFAPQAVGGGFVGTLIQGFQRSIFSNGAGSGTAAIAHSAARTSKPIRQGLLASLEPFIDTVIVCNLTAIAIVVTRAYSSANSSHVRGIAMTEAAFRTGADWLPLVLAFIVLLFAFSTIVSWSYYGEQCWAYLFGDRTTLIFKLLFITCLFIGSVTDISTIIHFSDIMLLLMAVPNLFGCFLLCEQVVAEVKDYFPLSGGAGELGERNNQKREERSWVLSILSSLQQLKSQITLKDANS